MKIEEARKLAEVHLAQALPQRWAHVQGVTAKARALGKALFGDEDAALLESAAWLHDIGYAPDIKKTGCHPLDGALWLRANGVDERIVCFVAFHSGSRVEFEVRGLTKEAEGLREETGLLADALLYADLTTSHEGVPVTFEQRIERIWGRYQEGDIVLKGVTQALPLMRESIARVEAALGEAKIKI